MKKMRRLIPAIAMLLVSAVMLSTASFAWFTMNEAVSATGMQVKAKAAGNLLISENKMAADYREINVKLTNRSNHSDILPVTYIDNAWKVPVNSGAVDTLYGGLTSDEGLTEATGLAYGTSNYFMDYTVYIATAGAEMQNQHLYVTMDMISAIENIYPAYSVAFYVGDPAQGADLGTFAGYINYKTFDDATSTTKVYLNGTYNIPTTYEKTSDTAAGLRITMRVFVDGNLKYDGQVYTQVPNYIQKAAGSTYGAGDNLKYYALVGTDYVLQDKTLWTSTTSTAGLYTWDGTMKNGTLVDKYYVNNNNIPTGASSFDLTIGSTSELPTEGLVTVLPAASNNG